MDIEDDFNFQIRIEYMDGKSIYNELGEVDQYKTLLYKDISLEIPSLIKISIVNQKEKKSISMICPIIWWNLQNRLYHMGLI
jgi:hypothetical protein